MYKLLLGQGINLKTGARHNSANQVVELFNFSTDHPIFQSTYEIIQHTNKRELKILTYSIMEKLYSILTISDYLQNNWNEVYSMFSQNRQEYDNLCKTLPQIPLLKEYFDAFCTETKDAISYMLTLFKVYCMHKNILDKAVTVKQCLDFINKHNLANLKNIFEQIQKIDEQFRQIRNAMVHPENYNENMFLLSNIYLNADNMLMPPMFEYKTNKDCAAHDVLKYMYFMYNSLLSLSKQFLTILV